MSVAEGGNFLDGAAVEVATMPEARRFVSRGRTGVANIADRRKLADCDAVDWASVDATTVPGARRFAKCDAPSAQQRTPKAGIICESAARLSARFRQSWECGLGVGEGGGGVT